MKNVLSHVISTIVIAVMASALNTYATDEVKPPVATDSATTQTSRSTQPPALNEKEAAFRDFYKRDPACDSFKDDNMMDRCRHAYMIAKKEFEKVWANRKQDR